MGTLTADILSAFRDQFCQVPCVEMAGAVAFQACKSAGLRFLSYDIFLPLGQSCEEVAKGQLRDILAWE